MSEAGSLNVERVETWQFPLTTPANHYVLHVRDKMILIDSGAKPLKNSDKIEAVILTHWHWDHSLGITGLRGVDICASEDTITTLSSLDNIMNKVLTPLRAMGLSYKTSTHPIVQFFEMIKEKYNEIVESINNNKIYKLGECPYISDLGINYFPCPGHTLDHYCFHLGNYVFVGDNVTLGESPTTIDYGEYIITVLKIMSLTWDKLAPGHGEIINREKSFEYFKNIIKRKNKRLLITATMIREGEENFNNLLKKVYGLNPEPQSYVAARTLIGYLQLLEKQGLIRIEKSETPWKIIRRD